MKNLKILEIALPVPVHRYFDYRMPENTHEPQVGMRVMVPFGNRKLIGIITSIKSTSELAPEKLKFVYQLLDTEPALSPLLVELITWAASYYQHPAGECFQAAMPALLRKGESLELQVEQAWCLVDSLQAPAVSPSATRQKAIIDYLNKHPLLTDTMRKSMGFSLDSIRKLAEKNILIECDPDTEDKPAAPTFEAAGFELNKEQSLCIEAFRSCKNHFSPILLEGVTGSGKTEVYFQAIKEVLEDGKQVLVMVPEIGLTPQTLMRFRQRFHCDIAVFHSGLTDKQRFHEWLMARSGKARIMIGTRSSLFTPSQDLGLIIVDEEHDLSYKQQDGLRYSARDLACVRAKLENIPLIMGTATPSLETLNNAATGKFEHWTLKNRAGDAKMPEIQLVDIRHQAMHEGIAESILPDIQACLENQEQALLFINRRGFAPTLICHDCGWVSQCHACDARLTYHKSAGHLRCHHCQCIEPIPHQCPQCQGFSLVHEGTGTERISLALKALFPETPVFRIDRDTSTGKSSFNTLMGQLEQHPSAILTGTQMLSKGHHFPNVTLVVVLEADGAMMSTDFRSMERLGQQLVQVMGRAGRAEKPGRALVQTHFPNHPGLNKLLAQGYHRFAMDLLAERHQLGLPPFSFQALLRLEDKQAAQAENALKRLVHYTRKHNPAACQLIGPYPASLQRRAHYFRFQLLIQCQSRQALNQCVQLMQAYTNEHFKHNTQRWSFDIDPVDMS